jgi:hypothetical protein
MYTNPGCKGTCLRASFARQGRRDGSGAARRAEEAVGAIDGGASPTESSAEGAVAAGGAGTEAGGGGTTMAITTSRSMAALSISTTLSMAALTPSEGPYCGAAGRHSASVAGRLAVH